MKAIVINAKGPAESLYIAEMPDPTPGPQDVVVDVSYAGVNHGDVIRRERGIFPAGNNPPYILGLEGAGTVHVVGRDVQSVKSGQRVAFLVEHGAYAQRVVVPESQILPLPDDIPDQLIAGSVCVGLTAYHLVKLANVKNDTSVLVHGGAGGVGATLVQLCKNLRARVYTTTGSPRKHEFAQSIGADVVLDRLGRSFSGQIMSDTNGKGVDVIFDCIGKEVVDGNFECLKPGGQLFYYGSSSGHPQFPGDKVLLNELRIRGFVIFNTWHNRTVWDSGVEGLLSLLQDGRLRIQIKELPMSEVVLAHKMLERREVLGKLVLNMR